MENYTKYLADKAFEAANEDYPREKILEAVKGGIRIITASTAGRLFSSALHLDWTRTKQMIFSGA